MEKILLVDDEQPTLKMFSLFLSAYGYEVFTAESGEQGLEVFKAQRPHLVLTDVKMPGMDGLELLQKIKELDADTEVVVITGHGDMDLAIKALNLDATDFINKPIQKEALDNALKRAHERIRMAGEKDEDITFEPTAKCSVINFKGNVTSTSGNKLSEACGQALSAGNKKVILRFNNSSSINGAGLTMLGDMVDKLTDDGRAVGILGLADNFIKVFEVVGITAKAHIYDRSEEISDC